MQINRRQKEKKAKGTCKRDRCELEEDTETKQVWIASYKEKKGFLVGSCL
jgi:hypothetical protein